MRARLCAILVAASSCAQAQTTSRAAEDSPAPEETASISGVFSSEEHIAARRRARARVRRVIMNNDGMDAVSRAPGPSPEQILDQHTTGLIGSHVDSICYNTNIGGFGLFFHHTRVGEVFTSVESRPDNPTAALIAQGTDALRIMANFSRRNNLEIFWSLRINNTHDNISVAHRVAAGENKIPDIFSKFKREHPELLMGKKADDRWRVAPPLPVRGSWTAVDFGDERVRQMTIDLVEEVCRNYPVHGVEIDFDRFPILFRSVSAGGTVSADDREKLTGMMSRIRKVMDKVGMERGEPILLAIKGPNSVEYCRDIVGMDLERWLGEDWIDLLVVGADRNHREWKDGVRLGQRFGIPVYPSLGTKDLPYRDTDPAWRGEALQALVSGAAGIATFNLFAIRPPGHPIWRELGDAGILTKRERWYFSSRSGIGGARNAILDRKYFTTETLSPMPATRKRIQGESPVEVSVLIPDEPPFGADQGVKWELCLYFTEALQTAMKVDLNGHELTNGIVDEDALHTDRHRLHFNVPPRLLRHGKNLIRVRQREISVVNSLSDLIVKASAPSASP